MLREVVQSLHSLKVASPCHILGCRGASLAEKDPRESLTWKNQCLSGVELDLFADDLHFKRFDFVVPFHPPKGSFE